MRLHGWKLKSGRGGMIAAGVDGDGAAAQVGGITSIEPRGRSIIAIDRKGEEHELVVGGQSS